MNSLSIFAAIYLSAAPIDQPEYPYERNLCEDVAVEIRTSVEQGYLSATDGESIIKRCIENWQ